MNTSDNGIFALALHEGLVPAPYLDSVNVMTYGVGHTAAAGSPDPASLPKGNPPDLDAAVRAALVVFKRDLGTYEAAVAQALRVPVEQHEFDALVSFHFNTGGIGRASLTRLLNSGDKAGAADGFMGWRRPASIIPRRESEQRLFRDGIYPSGRVPIYAVTASNRPGQIVQRLSQSEFLALLPGPGLRPQPRPTGNFWEDVAGLFRAIIRGKSQ